MKNFIEKMNQDFPSRRLMILIVIFLLVLGYTVFSLWKININVFSGKAYTQKPDLITQRIGTNIQNPLAGQQIRFVGEIKNQGDSMAPLSTSRFRLDLNADNIYELSLGNPSTGSLMPGTTEKEISNQWITQSGFHRIEFCADISNKILESNETNNCSTQTFLVGISESFETGLGGWIPDHYIECENQQPPCLFDWKIERSTAKAQLGNYSLRAYLNGSNDDGTIWLEKYLSVPKNSTIEVNISFSLWSDTFSEVNTWPVIAYAGISDPETEKDFPIIGQTNKAAGWTKYSYATRVSTDSTGKIWIAFGFGAVWEAIRTHYMDSLSVSLRQL